MVDAYEATEPKIMICVQHGYKEDPTCPFFLIFETGKEPILHKGFPETIGTRMWLQEYNGFKDQYKGDNY